MEGPAAFDGGRGVKSGLLAFGALIWAAPALAQDPLAPLPTTPIAGPSNPSVAVQLPAVQPAPPPARVARARGDGRGVFDAIDSGNGAAARAGIATLPRSVLTPLARAELFTAKNSPVVDLGSIQVRYRARPVQGEALADQLRSALEPLVKANDAVGAETLLMQYG